jgi:hypothetical protein
MQNKQTNKQKVFLFLVFQGIHSAAVKTVERCQVCSAVFSTRAELKQHRIEGSILQNSISAKNFSDYLSSSNFWQISTKTA